MKFKELLKYQTFDWIDDKKPGYNSFFKRCSKISTRKYVDSDRQIHHVGSINAEVFHVGSSYDYKDGSFLTSGHNPFKW